MPVYWRGQTATGAWSSTGTTASTFWLTSPSFTTPITWYSATNNTTTAYCTIPIVLDAATQAGLLISRHYYDNWPSLQEAPVIAAPYVRRRPNPPPEPEAVEAERIDRLRRQEARERAQQILRAHLTDEQRDTMERLGWFVVEGERSKQRYRIRALPTLVANVDVMDGELVRHRLCAHCDVRELPLHDHLLAQKLMLECSEDDFLRIANRHPRG